MRISSFFAVLVAVAWVAATSTVLAGDRKSEKNVSYGPHERNVMDIYWDSDFKDAPIVFTIHGGGFKNGDKNYCDAQMQELFLSRGCVVVSPNYRMLNGKGAKAISDCSIDCAMAVAWVLANAEKYGGDPKRVISTGGSAGGYLSARVAYCKKWDWPAEAKYKPDSLNVIGWYGDSPFLPKYAIESVAAGDAPGFMIYGEREHPGTPAKMGHAMRAQLEEHKVWNGMVYVPKAGHVPGKKLLLSRGRNKEAFAPFEAFLDMVIEGKPAPKSHQLTTLGQ